ncbi:MAG: HlyD family efflux transporter periplasmic adaptor subunit [Sandaracinaceae bacterium]
MSSMTSTGPYREPAPLPCERLVPPPTRARRVAFGLAGAFAAFVVFALVSPWQQNVRGTGRVIAYAPLERRQNVEAPVGGRVVEWFVQEGSVVEEGDPIVRISDNDPQLMDRLAIEREATAERLRSYEARVTASRSRLEAVIRAQASAIASYDARVRAARQSVTAAEQAEVAADADLDTTLLQLARQRALREQGLASQRELELATLAEARSRTSRDAARARARAAQDDLSGKQAELERARADRDAAIESARSTLQSAESDAASARASLARLDVRISRQEAQLVVAPRAGTIFRLVANQGGEQVSAGDTLAVLVPDTRDRAVEVWVDGNDAALIAPGRPVRLQFEGWPAVQFTGWPSVAVGTFGGRVAFVDSTDDGRGSFRVVVVPDPEEEPWPSARFLRQGVRANGWVLLNRVTVGFELWRQLNGFPPVLDTPPSTDPGASSYGGGYGGGGYGGGSYADGDGEGYGDEGGY